MSEKPSVSASFLKFGSIDCLHFSEKFLKLLRSNKMLYDGFRVDTIDCWSMFGLRAIAPLLCSYGLSCTTLWLFSDSHGITKSTFGVIVYLQNVLRFF